MVTDQGEQSAKGGHLTAIHGGDDSEDIDELNEDYRLLKRVRKRKVQPRGFGLNQTISIRLISCYRFSSGRL